MCAPWYPSRRLVGLWLAIVALLAALAVLSADPEATVRWLVAHLDAPPESVQAYPDQVVVAVRH